LLLFTIEDDDDLFLYEEDDFLDEKEAIIVAFGDNEMIEALIIVLSHTYSFSFSQTLLLCLLFLSPLFESLSLRA